MMSDWGSRALWYRRNDTTRPNANCFYKVSITAGETVTFSVSGDRIAIGTWGCDGVTTALSRFEVRVDGILKTIYDPNGKVVNSSIPSNNDQYTQAGIINDAIFLYGLGSGTHSIELKYLDGGKTGVWDYAVSLKTPTEAANIPAFIHDIPLASTGVNIGYNYPGFPTYSGYLVTASTNRRVALQTALPGYPLSFIDINTTYRAETVPTDVQSDGIHPSNNGATKIATRAKQYMSTNTYIAPVQTIYLANTTPITFPTSTYQVNTNGVITSSNPTADSYGATGLCNLKLAANTNGWIGFKVDTGRDAILGLNSTFTQEGYATFETAFWLAGNTRVGTIDNGTIVGNGSTLQFPTIGDYMRLNRQGSKITLERMPVGTTTWNIVFTYTYTSSADLYAVSDIFKTGVMQYPQGLNLVVA